MIDSKSVFDFKGSSQAEPFNFSRTSQKINHEQVIYDLGINLDNSNLTEEKRSKLYNFLGSKRNISQKTCLSKVKLTPPGVLTKKIQ